MATAPSHIYSPIPSHHHPLPPPFPSYHYAAAYPPPPPGFVPDPMYAPTPVFPPPPSNHSSAYMPVTVPEYYPAAPVPTYTPGPSPTHQHLQAVFASQPYEPNWPPPAPDPSPPALAASMAAVAPTWPFPSAPLAPSTAPTPSSPLPLPASCPWTPPPPPSGAPSSSTSGTPSFPPVQGVPYSPVALHDQARPLLLQDSEVDAFQRHYLARLPSSPSTRSDPIPLATSATCSSPADHQSTPTSACAAVTNQAEGPGFPTTGNRMHQDRVPAGLNDLAQQLKLAHRSLLNINRQLDEYAQSQRSSVVSLQRKLSQLAYRLATPRVSSSALSTTTAPTPSVDFAPSPGSKTVAASAPSIFSAEASSAASSVSSRFGASGSTYAAPQVFAEMPRPNFGHGTPVIAPRYENYGSGYSNQIPSSYVQGRSTNLSEQNPDAMPVYDLYEEDAITSQSYVHPTVDIIEAVSEELEVKVYGFKPIICPEKPTDGVYSSANENKYENELHTVCFNNASDSEEATYLKFSHAPVVHSDGFIKLTTENSTQATSTLCVHEAIVYCHDERPEHINCTNGLEPVQLKFEQEDILIGGAVSNIVYSIAWELVASPSHSINHAKLRLLWDPGASASIYSSKAKPPEGLSSVAIGFPEVLKLYNQVGSHVQQLRVPCWKVLLTRERRVEWDRGGHTILSSTLNRDILRVPSCVSPQIYCKVPLRQESRGIQSEWDPDTLSIMDVMLGKTAVSNRVHSRPTPCTLLILIGQHVDLNRFWAQLLPCHSWWHTLNDFLQVQCCFLPLGLDCPYSEPNEQLVCCASTFRSTEAIHSAMSMSTASTVRMILILSYGKVAQEGRDASAVYHVFKIQLPVRINSLIWDPGIDSLLFLHKLLHIHLIQLVDSITSLLMLAYQPHKLQPIVQATLKLVSLPQDIWFSIQTRLTAGLVWQYLKTWEIGTFFITFLPP